MLKKMKHFITYNQSKSTNSKKTEIPKHVAIIMDGNGRWAKKRGLPRIAGHRAGMKVIKEIVKAADEAGVEILTLYAFSTENWKRPKDEVDFLMQLPQEYLKNELNELMERNVQVRMIGNKENLPAHTLASVEEAITRTSKNTGLILNFALNYGSRAEILEVIKKTVKKVQNGEVLFDDIDEQFVGSLLYTGSLPDPDLLIRTSGEVRLSNFMLWQLAYTEMWFTDVLWPDFTREKFFEALEEYKHRTRRYGAL